MNRLLIASLLVTAVLHPARARAQNLPAPEKFSLAGKVSGLSVSGERFVAADAEVRLALTPHWALRQDTLLVMTSDTDRQTGPVAQIYTAGLEYTTPNPLARCSCFLADSSRWRWYITAQLGVSRTAANQVIAARVGGGLRYQATDRTRLDVFELGWLHGAVPVATTPEGVRYGSNGIFVSVGIHY